MPSQREDRRSLESKVEKALALFDGSVTAPPGISVVAWSMYRRWSIEATARALNVHPRGLVRNEPDSFWTPRLSHAFAHASAESSTAPKRRGSRPPRDELMVKAKGKHGAVQSYGQIATNLGISKATAWRLVNLETA